MRSKLRSLTLLLDDLIEDGRQIADMGADIRFGKFVVHLVDQSVETVHVSATLLHLHEPLAKELLEVRVDGFVRHVSVRNIPTIAGGRVNL